ncbi:hypothetical protein AGMMS49992_14450 [Clostridia bacterium]|nr:hypothetical protein AGMMS49992_14450 [Clostridia bacterium]
MIHNLRRACLWILCLMMCLTMMGVSIPVMADGVGTDDDLASIAASSNAAVQTPALRSVTLPQATAAEKAKVFIMPLPLRDDKNQNNWGHPAFSLMNGWTSGETNSFAAKALGSYGGPVVYCIEPGIHLYTNDELEYDESFWDNYPSDKNDVIDAETIKVFIGRILLYGYNGNNSTSWDSAKAADRSVIGEEIATQLLIWETIVGERSEGFQKYEPSAYEVDLMLDMISPDHPCYTEIMEHYNRIVDAVQAHSVDKLPSFAEASASDAPVYTLTWNGSEYEVIIEDENFVADRLNYKWDIEGLNIETTDRSIKLTSVEPITEQILVTVSREANSRRGVVVWGKPIVSDDPKDQRQKVTFAQGYEADELIGYFKLETELDKVELGKLRIIKTTDKDGPVEGFSFRVTGPLEYDKVFVTSKTGEIIIDDLAVGEYTVHEIRDNASMNYIIPADKIASVEGGLVATVEMHNAAYEHITADGDMPGLWIAIGLISLAGIAVLFARSRRQHN